MASGDRTPAPFTEWLAGNVGWLGGLALFLVVSLRIMRVSGFDPTTAGAIVQDAGVPSVVLAILVSNTSLLLTLLAFAILALVTYPSISTVGKAILWPSLIALLVVAVLTIFWFQALWLIVGFAGYFVFRQFSHRSGRLVTASNRLLYGRETMIDLDRASELRQEWESIQEQGQQFNKSDSDKANAVHAELSATEERVNEMSALSERTKEFERRLTRTEASARRVMERSVAFILATFVLMGTTLVGDAVRSRPWLPPEVLSVANGPKVLGYVLSDSGNWVKVLNESDRSIVRIAQTEVTERRTCRIGRARRETTLWEIVTHKAPSPKYPECKTLV